MVTSPYTVAEPAKLQVENLPQSEKIALRRLFRDDRTMEGSKPLSGGTFVARFGSRRVLWRRDAGGRPVILSVLDQSYAATP